MNNKVKEVEILLVEDNSTDAELAIRELKKSIPVQQIGSINISKDKGLGLVPGYAGGLQTLGDLNRKYWIMGISTVSL
jgi:hypothetical protein